MTEGIIAEIVAHFQGKKNNLMRECNRTISSPKEGNSFVQLNLSVFYNTPPLVNSITFTNKLLNQFQKIPMNQIKARKELQIGRGI